MADLFRQVIVQLRQKNKLKGQVTPILLITIFTVAIILFAFLPIITTAIDSGYNTSASHWFASAFGLNFLQFLMGAIPFIIIVCLILYYLSQSNVKKETSY